MSEFIHLLNGASAIWGEMMLRTSVTGGAVIALLWALCRWWPSMSPVGRSWLWRAAFAKMLLTLCWGLSLGVPFLPIHLQSAPQTPTRLVVAAPPNRLLPEPTVSHTLPLPSSPTITPQTPTIDERPDHSFGSPPVSLRPSSSPTNTTISSPTVMRPTLTVESSLLMCWLLGAGFLSLRALRAWRLTRRWGDEGESITDSALTASLSQLCQYFDLARLPQLRSCPFIDTLALTGVWRPTIFLAPRFLQEEGQKAPLPLMLAHELAHHKRRDLAWNWLLWIRQTLFWFHPLVWVGARGWRMAQEVACDELAIKATQVPVAAYGAMLLQSAIKGRSLAPDNLFAVGVGERYATLHQRLSAMKHFSSNTNHKRALMLCALFGVTTLLPWHLAPQSALAQATRGDQNPAPQDTELAPVEKLNQVAEVSSPSPTRTVRQSQEVLCLTYSPDGELLAQGGAEGEIRIYNAHTHQLQQALRGQSHQIYALAWSPDSQTLAVSNGELWDRATWRVRQKLDMAPQNFKLPYTLFNDCVSWSPDGQLTATGGSFFTLMRRQGANWQALLRERSHDWIYDVNFSPDGRFLAEGGMNHLSVWDAQALKSGKLVGGRRGRGIDRAFQKLVARHQELARLKAPTTKQKQEKTNAADALRFLMLKQMQDESGIITKLAFSPDSRFLAVAYGAMKEGQYEEGHDGKIVVWDTRTWNIVRRFTLPGASASSLSWSPNSRLLGVGEGDLLGQDNGAQKHLIRVWECGTGHLLQTFAGHSAQINALTWSPDGATLASGSRDRTVRLWDITKLGEPDKE